MRRERRLAVVLIGPALCGVGLLRAPADEPARLDRKLPDGALVRVRVEDPRWKGHTRALAFGPGDRLVVAGEDAVRLCDAGTGREVRLLGEHSLGVHGLALSADGTVVASWATHGAPRFRDVETGKEIRFVPEQHGFRASAAVLSSDFTLVASSGPVTPAGVLVELWDTRTGKKVRSLNAGEGTEFVQFLFFSPDGRWLACLKPHTSPPLVLWDLSRPDEAVALEPKLRTPQCLAFSPDGRTLAVAGEDGGVVLLDPASAAVGRRIKGPPVPVRALAFAPDGRCLACGGGDGTVRVLEVAGGGERRRFAGHQGEARALAFAPDGRRLASGGVDPSVYVWAVHDREAALPEALSDEEMQRFWVDLLDRDAARAYRALRTLAARPERSLPFLKERLRVGEPFDPEILRLVEQLDDEAFAVREKAARELTQRGEKAEPALRRALAGQPSVEMRRRLMALLGPLEAAEPSPDRLRAVRAVETLESIGTPEALRLLRQAADGSALPWVSSEARTALNRLKEQPGKP